MNNEQVAHAWAHGRAGKGSNLYSDGQKLTSYNTTIAARIDDVIYISLDNMSPTTSKHLAYARQAVNHERENIFYTPAFSWSGSNPALTHKAMILPAVRDAIQTLETALSAPRTRKATKEAAIITYNSRREEIQELAAKVGVVIPDMTRMEVTPEAVAEYQENKRKEAERKEATRIEAERVLQAEKKAEFGQWLATGQGSCPWAYRRSSTGGTDYLTIKGDKVVTSQGAEAPLDHVIKALMFYNKRAHTGTDDGEGAFVPYHTNGHKIPLGIFTLDEIKENGDAKAGCHYFTAAEIQRFINQWKEVLGL